MASITISPLNLLLNILGYIFENKIVAIYVDNSEVLVDCDIVECVVNDKAQLMEHPTESGTKISDHKVFQPMELTLTIALPYLNSEKSYDELYSLFRGNAVITVQTKAQVYKNLQIISIPHEERAGAIDRLFFKISLKEAIIVTPMYAKIDKVANKADAPTVEHGVKETTGSSMLYDIYKGVSGLF